MFVPTLTINIMKIDVNKLENIEVDGIDTRDYPDFVDAFISYAEMDGVELTDEQLNELNDDYPDLVYLHMNFRIQSSGRRLSSLSSSGSVFPKEEQAQRDLN